MKIVRFRFGDAGAHALLGLALFAAAGFAQTPVWVNNYSGLGNQNEAWAIAECPDLTVVVTGVSIGSDMTRDIVTQKIRRDSGAEVWVSRWSNGEANIDEGFAVACDDSGDIFVAGLTYSAATDTDFVTIKYRPNGDTAWVRRFNNVGADAATEVVADGRGGCFTVGHSSSVAGNGNQDYFVIHYDKAGEVRWTNRLSGAGVGQDIPHAAILDPAGWLYVTGSSWVDPVTQYDYLTVKYDTLDGDTVWTRGYDGSGGAPQTDDAYDVTLDDSGYVYVTGRAGEQGTWWDATTVKYGPDGSTVWTNRFDAGWLGYDGGAKVLVDKDYNVYVGGVVQDAIDMMYDFLLLRIRQDATVGWWRTYDGGVEDDDSLTAMAMDRNGNVYVTGYTYVFQGDLDWMTMKYSRDGAKIWSVMRQTFGEDDQPYDMVLDDYGELYVAGFDFAGPDENYVTIKYTEDDVGSYRVVLPNDSFRIGATVTPRAWVRNYSALPSAPFATRFEVGNFYYDAQMVSAIAAYDSVMVQFAPWRVEATALGTHQVRCYTMLDVDKDLSNDTTFSQATGVTVWEHLASLPPGPKGKAVKDGGSLGPARDSLVFAFKGQNTIEFYMYNARTDAWSVRETIPSMGSGGRKKVKGGARLAWGGGDTIFAFKGNNTLEFWKYSIGSDRWGQGPDFPVGAGRRIKAGAQMEFVSGAYRDDGANVNGRRGRNSNEFNGPDSSVSDRLFACRGNNTLDFCCYDLTSRTWVTKSPVPSLTGKKCKEGTVMGYDGDNTIYLLKGGTLEFYGYSIARDSWYAKKPIRYSLYSKKRKMKKGAGGAFDTLYRKFYVMKGYKSGEFWYFDPAADTWVEPSADSLPTPPGTKPVYAGADLAYGGGKLWALRGNKTLDFYRFNADFPLGPVDGGGAQASVAPVSRLQFGAMPNPFTGRTTLRYSLSAPGYVRLVLYDASGRVARVAKDGWETAGRRDVALRSDGLAAGVYLARLQVSTEAGTQESVKKLLISK